MKKKNIFYLLLPITVVLNIFCNNEPKIEFDEMSHDFGIVNQQKELKHTFTFRNAGSGVLIIEKIKAG